MKYVCDVGYVFVEEPVPVNTIEPTSTTTAGPSTTTVAMDWKSFQGAQYALGSESDTDSWQIARDKCKNAGGDLATIQSWAVQNFINGQFGTSNNIWIGAKRSSSSGAFTWANGDSWEFKNWKDCNHGSKLCVKIDGGENGRWEDEDCDTNNIPRYLCQKGSSTGQMWETILGAEYSYMEDDDCFDDWTDTRDRCQSYPGANIASIISQEVSDAVMAYVQPLKGKTAFSHCDFFIGLNDIASEGTFVWEKGEALDWTNWAVDEPVNYNNYDCVCVKIDDSADSGKWKAQTCTGANTAGVLCMKGSSTSVGSGRKKRMVTQTGNRTLLGVNEEPSRLKEIDRKVVKNYHQYSKTEAATENPDPIRNKRSIENDPMYSRTITCQSLFGGSAAYWKYESQVPKYCFSKNFSSLLISLFMIFLISGVNCTKEDLDKVTTKYSDVKLVGYTGNLSYAVTYK